MKGYSKRKSGINNYMQIFKSLGIIVHTEKT